MPCSVNHIRLLFVNGDSKTETDRYYVTTFSKKGIVISVSQNSYQLPSHWHASAPVIQDNSHDILSVDIH